MQKRLVDQGSDSSFNLGRNAFILEINRLKQTLEQMDKKDETLALEEMKYFDDLVGSPSLDLFSIVCHYF